MKENIEDIHVCYAVSDPGGTYSKFAGTSICSMFENTESRVTVHLLHDDTLTDENRERFSRLAEHYGRKIRYYNAPKLAEATWKKAKEIYPDALSSKRFTPANMYRLLLPEVLPPDVEKVIYLDADTIFNLDVSELWAETVDSGLAAVSDLELLEHYGVECEMDEAAAPLYETSNARLETVFNAGMLVFRLDVMRKWGNLLLEGVRCLAEHKGEYISYDNDILIYFFSESYTHLPWYYNIRLSWDISHVSAGLVKGIYHYLGRNYDLEGKDPRHRLFLDYYSKTPWFGTEALYRGCLIAQGHAIAKAQRRLQEVRQIFNLCCRRKRVFVGLAEDEESLRRDFSLGIDEPYMKLAPGDALRLPYPVDTHVYLFFWSNYGEIKKLMENAGYREYEHFADGTKLMPEHTNDLLTNNLTWLWNI